MKRKLFAVTLACLLMFGVAGPVLASNFDVVEIMNVTLDDDPVAQNSDELLTGGYQNIAFVVEYDETEVGGGLSVAITVTVSHDGTTYQSAKFFDFDGGSTLQSSETLSTDSDYYLYFNRDMSFPYTRIVATATGSDTDDTADVVVTFVGRK